MISTRNQINELIDFILKFFVGKNNFLNDLIYGKKMSYFDIQERKEESAWAYLHEYDPEIMILMSENGKNFIFDVRRVRLLRFNYKYEMIFELKPSLYLIIEDFDEEIVLLFSTVQERETFYRSFKFLSNEISSQASGVDSVVLKNFIRADRNQNLEISLPEMKVLMHSLKMEVDGEKIGLFYVVQDGRDSDVINFREFQKLIKMLSCHKELIQPFEKYAGTRINSYQMLVQKVMRIEEFKQFLQKQQQQSLISIHKICQRLFPTENSKLSFYDFCQFLTSGKNSAIDPNYMNFQINQDLPLNYYYCYSSHNTYLTGNQITSDSRAERYIEDLEDGVRCLEIDTHDGYDQPIVKHGYTATAAITFKQAIAQIDKFHRENEGHTPIILSIENHCTNLFQLQMAKILEHYLGQDIIHINDFSPEEEITLKAAMNKIIIKCSGTLKIYNQILGIHEKDDFQEQSHHMEEEEKESSSESQMNQEIPSEQNEENVKNMVFNLGYQKKKEIFSMKRDKLEYRKASFIKKRVQIQKFMRLSMTQKKHEHASKNLNLKLLTLTSMLGNGNFGRPSKWESVSMNENKILNLFMQKKQGEVKKHTKKGWIRVYPKGSRFDSSNYNPLPAMEMGAQIIALNTQSPDYSTHLMKKFFMKGFNKTAGYRSRPNLVKFKQINTVRIIPLSAKRIYFNDQSRKDQMPNCQIRMRFYGLYRDIQYNKEEIAWSEYTEAIKNNAYNPIFQKAKIFTVKYHCEEIGFIAMEIQGCGIGILPLDSLRKGYRMVILYDDEFKPKESKILCMIE